MRLLATALFISLLAGCADEADDRQFAGDEQTMAQPTATSQAAEAPRVEASPNATEPPLSEAELFLATGNQVIVSVISDRRVLVYDYSARTTTVVSLDESQRAWHVDLSPDESSVAILVSPSKSLDRWDVVVVGTDGAISRESSIVGSGSTVGVGSDVVATGTGGIDWSPDGSQIAVALPTGGIYVVDRGGSVQQMSSPGRVSRPGVVAWSPTGDALAFSSQPDALSGLGVSVAPTNALPLDAVTLLRPDQTGNRSVTDLYWSPDGESIFAVVERRETGGARGEVFALPAAGGNPEVIWSPTVHHVNERVQAISVSPDGRVLAILVSTGPHNAAVVLKQVGGDAQARRILNGSTEHSEMIWTQAGLLVAGMPTGTNGNDGLAVFEIDANGVATQVEPQATPMVEATPEASPIAVSSPIGSPIAVDDPEGTPVAEASPAGSPAPNGSPEASPQAVASPRTGATPGTDD